MSTRSLESAAGAQKTGDRSVWAIWWPRLRMPLTVAFFAAVAVLLVLSAREVQWRDVARVIRGYEPLTVLTAGTLALAGHALYTLYDQLAGRYTGHRLSRARLMSIAFVSYAFNLSLGPIIGAIGFRYRLYSKAGLSKGVITRVLGFAIVSNWLGYLLLAGVLFSVRAVQLPDDWAIGTSALQVLGVAMTLLVVGYVWMSARSRRRSFTVRDLDIELPPVRMALLQVATSCACWLAIGVVLYVLLRQQIAFPTVLGVLLVAAVAALTTHIPAGLGVLEATFLLLLGHRLPSSELLAAVLTYRVLYYLFPLVLASCVFVFLETRDR